MTSERKRALVGFASFALLFAWFLPWPSFVSGWSMNDTAAFISGLFAGVSICFYVQRVWDFRTLRPYDKRTITAVEAQHTWMFPASLLLAAVAGPLATFLFGADGAYVLATGCVVAVFVMLMFMVIQLWKHRNG